MLSNEGSDPMKIFGAGAASHFLPGCLGAMDLLRNLPEGVTTTTWPTKYPEHLRRSTTCPIPLQCPGSHGLPRSHPIDGSTCSASIARPVESSCSSLRKRPKGDSTLSFYKQATESSTCNVVATTDGSTSVNLQVHAIENSPCEIRSLDIQPTGGIITSIPSSVIVSGASSATSITTC
ncbi:uncharacterized protein LOC125045749 [Penaeus chinensis]|uniref:uncharacterized protein LOC125045749 n=1 Tax=Penaeus chinensis TaxID=139456 RepID=UPI001FB83AB9|nr:uncharacterized protein LOC125045749 [Penaeus chinensis]